MNTTAVFTIIILVIAMIIFMPLCVIWAINTLFATNIEYNFFTWLAVVILSLFIKPDLTLEKK